MATKFGLFLQKKSNCFFFVSRWNRAILGPSVHPLDPLYKTLFWHFWFRPPNAQNLLPKICTKSPITWLVWQIDHRCLGLPWVFRDVWFNGTMQNVVGLTLVAMATNFGLGAEIQSPTGLSCYLSYSSKRANSFCICSVYICYDNCVNYSVKSFPMYTSKWNCNRQNKLERFRAAINSDRKLQPHTPLTPTRLNCRVESCRRKRCVLNLQNSSQRIWSKNWKLEHVENLSSRVGCRIGNWVTTVVGWVHTARHNSTRLNMLFSFQFTG